jgi:hypothetical protein
MIDRIQEHFGLARMPFGRDLAPGMLHRHAAHAEAAARITWAITDKALGVITGEVGVGKTVAVRAALATLDPTRHTVIYLPNPSVGTRGLHHHIVASLGGHPTPTAPSCSRRPPAPWPAKQPSAAAPPSSSSTRPTSWTTTSSSPSACSPTTTWTPDPRSPACSSASPPCAA